MLVRFALQVISLEGWVDIMYYVQDAHSFWDWVYFVALIVVSTEYLHHYCRCQGREWGGMPFWHFLDRLETTLLF